MALIDIMRRPRAVEGVRSSFALPAWLLPVGAVVFAVSLTGFLVVNHALGFGGYDLTVYLAGGEAFRHGTPVYDAQVHSDVGVGYFTYPPVTLLLFAPMSLLPLNVAHATMIGFGLLTLLGVITLAARLVGAEPGLGLGGAVLGLGGLVLWLQPVFDSITQGQINTILMLLILADLTLDGRRRWPTGVLIGVATAMKITPGIFIVYLLVIRRYRAAAVAAGTWAGLTALGFAVAGPDSVRFWFQGAFSDAARVTSPLVPGTTFNQSIHGILVRWFGDGIGGATWYVAALVVAIGGLAVALGAYRSQGRLAGALACAITGLLISPVSWHEHWVWMVPTLVLLADIARRLAVPVLVRIALPVAVALPFLMWPLPIAPGRLGPASVLSPARHMWEDEGNHGPIPLLLGTAYVSTGVILLLVAAWALWRESLFSDDAPVDQLITS